MHDPSKTNEELLEENYLLKQRIKELEQLKSGNRLTEEAQGDRRGHVKSKPEAIRASEVDLDDQELSDMITIPSIQALMEDFYKITHAGMAILDLKGRVLVAIGWQDICTGYHRVNPQTAAYCTESDLYLAQNVRQGEYVAYKCRNHLWDVVTPLYIGGKHVGNIYTGQFFYDDEKIDIETFANQADQYGFDKESYLAALKRVPRFSRDQVRGFMDFLTKLSIMISDLSYGNLKLARTMSRISGSLQESEGRYRSLVETTSDWIWETDTRGVYTYASPKVKDILGYEPSEVLGKTPLDLMPPDEADRVAKVMSEYVEKAKPFIGLENLNRHKDGRMVVLETSGVPIVDANGHLTGYRGVDRDVTKRKKAEDALRATFKVAPVGLAIIKDRVLQNVNQAWCDIVGYSESEIIGHTTRRLYEDEAEYERVGRALYPQLPERRIASLQTKHQRRDGTFRDVIVTMAPLRSEGSSLEAVVVVEDITDRRQKEAALRESEQALRTIFENTHDAIFIHDLEGRVLDCNQKVLDLYNVTRDQVLRLNIIDDFSSPDNQLGEPSINWKRIMEGETMMFAWKAKRPNDGFVFDVDVALKKIVLGNRAVILANVRDITARKALEEQLRQAQKMEAIGQLAGGVAHDFNNILQAILGYTNMVLLSLGPDDRHSGKLKEVEKAGEKAAALTRQLLAFSRRQVLQLGPLDLNSVIDDLMKMLRRLIGENIELSIRPDASLGKVNSDRSQMEQVVVNLCVNARDAMPDGGRLSIETQNVRLDDDDCTKNDLAKPGRYVQLSVTDSGCGMDPETKGKIFEPFFTTKEKWRGTGLGLATVYGIVRQHEGMIQVASEPGKGSRFDVYLPVIESTEEEPLKEGQTPPPGRS